jgi:DNA topoisomerase-1
MPSTAAEILTITRSKLKKIVNDPVKTAEAVNLIYVNDTEPGIRRIRKGKTFYYVMNDQVVDDENELKRIKSLVLPPAWENVWICTNEKGHLQATGIDARSRKQYKYHHLWTALRNHTKFYRLYDFGKTLPGIRRQLEKDLSRPGMPLKKVLATVVSLMEITNIRIGNNLYEKLYGSFGLTTLKDKHVSIKGSQLRFTFKGKKGIPHDITIRNKKLSSIVQKCKDIPGKELFQYYDESGSRQTIDSGMVNEYIKEICGYDFTAKDFRTWSGTLKAFIAAKEMGFAETQTELKKRTVEIIDRVAKHLGNTRNVCKKYYIHPAILFYYETRELEKYFSKLELISKEELEMEQSMEEKILLSILEDYKIH